MTLSAAATRVVYDGNGSSTVFAVSNGGQPIRFRANSHIKVLRRSTAGVVSTLVEGVGYNLTGGPAAGIVTLIAGALGTGEKLSIYRDQPYAQDVADLAAGGDFASSVVEDAFDHDVELSQELGDGVTRSLRLSRIDDATNMELPLLAARASKWLAFDLAGVPIPLSAPSDNGIQPRGGWANAAVYALDDVVHYEGTAYIATAAHTAAAVTTPGSGASWQTVWAVFVPKAITGRGAWTTATAYAVGDSVSNIGSSFLCITSHIAGAATEPGIGASWPTVWQTLLGGAAVLSVFGRTGAVMALDGDYSADKVVVSPTGAIAATRVQTALAELDTEKAPLASPALTGTPSAPTPLSSDNTTRIATTAMVQQRVADLIASAPGVLDTLNELAVALGNDPNFATTMTNALAGKQTLDTELTALAGLVSAADRLPYFTGSGTAALATFTAFARQLVDDADAATMRATLALGALATLNAVGAAEITDGSVGTAEIAADAVTTVKLLDANITFAKLAPAALGTAAQFRSNTADRLLVTDDVWSAADIVALTDAATIAVDMASGINFSVTLGANRTLGNPTSTKVGQSGLIFVRQDATGSRTLTYGANWEYAGGIGSIPALSTTANAKDILSYFVESATSIIIVGIIKGVT